MHNIEPVNKLPRVLIDLDADPVLFNFKRQMLEIFHDEQIITTNPRYTHYCRNKKRIMIEDDTLYRQ